MLPLLYFTWKVVGGYACHDIMAGLKELWNYLATSSPTYMTKSPCHVQPKSQHLPLAALLAHKLPTICCYRLKYMMP